MHLTLIITLLMLLLLPLTVLAEDSPKRQTHTLAPAAVQMKLKNYSTALTIAAELPEDGQRNLLMGIAGLKRGRNNEAADLLGKAAKSYPLLADYALYYQAVATVKNGQVAEAVSILKALQKGYPDSPLFKKSLLLEADTLFEGGDFVSAEPLYQKFIEQYPTGSDSLQASYRLASCKDKKGDGAGAVAIFRSLWLNSPGSAQASKAEAELKRLTASGIVLTPYSSQELFKRASTLYEERHYGPALTTLRAINTKAEKKDFIDQVQLKTGQALLKSRQYNDAENSLKELSRSAEKVEVMSAAASLMARAIEKGGRSEEAFNAYSLIAKVFPESAEADDALLDAAFIRKFQYRPKETVTLLENLLATYPETRLKNRIFWESGWAKYLAGERAAAAEQFKKLFSVAEYRERALFWHGRAATATGDATTAEADFAVLLKDFPFGFYALAVQGSRVAAPVEKIPTLAGALPEMLPLPDGFERVKALIALGLIEDASTELAAARKKLSKTKGDAGLARLYLELGNYNRAMSLYDTSLLNHAPESRNAWLFLYPQAFNELISKFSEKAGVDPSLAFAIMRSESSFSATATSPVGARGLMQLMPPTAAMLLHEKKIEPERLYDPELNIRLGTKHLRELLDKYNGNQIAVIASYNAGASSVNRWLKTYANLSGAEFIESIPYAETRDYVKKVLAAAALYKRLYGMK